MVCWVGTLWCIVPVSGVLLVLGFFDFEVLTAVSVALRLSLVDSLTGCEDFFGGIVTDYWCGLYNVWRVNLLSPIMVQ